MTEEKIKQKKKNKKSAIEKEMSFLEHLEELRWHIIRALTAIVLVGIVAFVFKDLVFDEVLFGPRKADFISNQLFCRLADYIGSPVLCINQSDFMIQNIVMSGQFSTHIKVSFIAGFIIAFPYVFWEFWRFIRPALHDNERKHSRGAVFWSSLLFILGAAFGYFVISPLTVHFFRNYYVSQMVENQINLISYISTVNSVVLSAAVIFELPVLIFFLSKAGLVTVDFLKKYRKHSLIVVLTLSAVITPPDIFSQILVSLPLMILYEIGIILAKRIEKKQKLKFNSE